VPHEDPLSGFLQALPAREPTFSRDAYIGALSEIEAFETHLRWSLNKTQRKPVLASSKLGNCFYIGREAVVEEAFSGKLLGLCCFLLD